MAKRLASLTGEPLDEAVKRAIQEKLTRLERNQCFTG